jgi:peptide/nickel transport system ATP-binding protein
MHYVTPSIPASAEATEARATVTSPLLSLTGLGVSFDTPGGRVVAVRDVTLSVARGECLAVVGESGAGKSQLFLAVMGLLAANGRAEGSARFGGTELLTLAPGAMRQVRGSGIGMVFQDPTSSLTPHLTVGEQLTEVITRHTKRSPGEARGDARMFLERVQVSDPAQRMAQYPHQLSGGMRQRVMIALALAGKPQLLILDEPTSSLDVTVQAQILALLTGLKGSSGTAMILITHDLGAVAGLADRVAVMRDGQVVETGAVRALLRTPRHPYTQTLLRHASGEDSSGGANITAGASRHQPSQSGGLPVLTLESVAVRFGIGGWPGRRAELTALSEISLELQDGEALGLVGESGCGKSTLARAALSLIAPSAGRVVWLGRDIAGVPPRELRTLRRAVQIVFQDPQGSLDPRMSVGEIVAEPLRTHEPQLAAAARRARVAEALASVGLPGELAQRYPHALSGGQCQRVGIARAIILAPRVLVCDEPLSALDAPTQQQVLSLLAQLRAARGMSLLFISHNLALVQRLCERVLVLYLGRMVEVAPTRLLFETPRHPYTRELLAAIPSLDPDVQPGRLTHVRPGEPPSPLAPPSGCVYRTRCPQAAEVCAQRRPTWEEIGEGRRIACHRWRG